MASVYDLFVNRLGSSSPGAVRDAQAAFSGPIVNGTAVPYAITGDLPVFPFTPNRASTNAAADVTVSNGDTLTLGPGTYRDLVVKDSTASHTTTLNLGDGVYDFRNVKLGKDVVVNTTDNTVLMIDQAFELGNGSTFGVGTSAGTQLFVGAYGLIGSNDEAAGLGRDNPILYAQLWCPFGDFNMGNHSDLYGRFWARDIGSDWNTNVTYMVPDGNEGAPPVPEPTTMTLAGMVLGGLFVKWRRRNTV